jgi:RNA polymerase sigma factor (sigma-70 family)
MTSTTTVSTIATPTTAFTEEQRLIQALLRGDDAALSAALALYQDLVFGVVRGIVIDARAAEDVTQDVFLYLWRNAGRVDLLRGSVRAFLVTVARRRAIDYVRREENRRRREDLVAAESPTLWRTTNEPDFADVVATSDSYARNAAALHTAMGKLPDPERVVIDLVYFHSHTLRGAATATNSPEGTAKCRVRRALRRLAAMIDESVVDYAVTRR